MVVLLQPGVRDDEIAVVEDVVRDESVARMRGRRLDELGRPRRQLVDGALEPVGDGDVPSAEGAV